MRETLDLTWKDIDGFVKDWIGGIGMRPVYGVPNGGMIAAGLIFPNVVRTPREAMFIIDDIEGTGATRHYYEERYQATFLTLCKSSQFNGKWVTFPWERAHPGGTKTIHDNITRIIQHIGEDPTRDGLKDTPRRVIKSYQELFSGYNKNPKDLFTTFENDGYDSMVLLKDIEVYSCCEHHMLPFYGKAHVAYIPNHGKIVGISKLARLVDIFARRLQVQERICEQVTNTLMEVLVPKGAACIIEAVHMCMCARGVGKQNSVMVTSSLRGEFLKDSTVRQELMNLI